MKTTWMIALMTLLGSIAQAANERVVLFNYEVRGVAISITAEAPVKDGGVISFKNARAEVKGQSVRIATRSLYQLWAEGSVCDSQEFKNLNVSSESAVAQKTLNMVTGEVAASDNVALAANINCMERPY